MSRISGYRNIRLRSVVVGLGMIALLLLGAAVVSADWVLDDGTICETPTGRRYTRYNIPAVTDVSVADNERLGIIVTWSPNHDWSGYHVSLNALDTCSPSYYTLNSTSDHSKRFRRQSCDYLRDRFRTPDDETLSLYAKVRSFYKPGRKKFLGDWSDTVRFDCAGLIESVA